MVRLLLILFLTSQWRPIVLHYNMWTACTLQHFCICQLSQLYFSTVFLRCISQLYFQVHFICWISALQNTAQGAVYCWLSTGASDTSRFERGMSTSRSKKRGFLDWSNPMSEIRRVSTQNETTSYVQWRLFHQPYLEGGPNVNCLPPQEVVVVAQNSSC